MKLKGVIWGIWVHPYTRSACLPHPPPIVARRYQTTIIERMTDSGEMESLVLMTMTFGPEAAGAWMACPAAATFSVPALQADGYALGSTRLVLQVG